jgi:hypothetical protein
MAGVYLATYNHKIDTEIDFAKNGNYSLNVKLAPNTVNPDAQLWPIEFSVDKIEDWDNPFVARLMLITNDPMRPMLSLRVNALPE